MRKETPIPIRPRMSDESGDVVPTVDASDDEMPGGVDESKRRRRSRPARTT